MSETVDQRQQQWAEILEATRKLRQMMADEQWAEMVELEARRGEQLRSFFSSPIPAEEASALAEDIRNIMESDQALMDMGREQQDKLSASVRQMVGNRKAISAYQRVQK